MSEFHGEMPSMASRIAIRPQRSPSKEIPSTQGGWPVSLSMNERAAELVDALVADADALGIEVRTLDSGARLVDCGAAARGGLQAGLGFAAACMGGLGRVDPAPVPVGPRTWPGVGVAVDEPAAACLAAQYAGWKLEHQDFFAMASGPGRALARAEDLFEELAWREQSERAVLCLETRQAPPAEIVEKVAQRCGVAPSALTFLIARTASVCGSVQISARVVETALHKLHELGVDPARVRSAWGCCPIAPVAADDPAAIGRTNDAVLYGGTVHLWIEASDEETADLAQRLPSAASNAFGTPFGELLAAANWNFYDIDPMLFSPAEVTLTSTQSGRAHHGGGLAADVLERSFGG
jgi:methenyltetrahydromethanopterin cyclohydrolase